MNKQNRKQLAEASELIAKAMEIIRTVADEEQEKFDNMTEGLQQTERGQKMEENATNLSSLADELENATVTIDEASE